ncbi:MULTISPECIES: hypothetical protein [unclassified Pseudomonas]|uniref:hypothetical protein n=1 Tax=unclassified Pseudomonas TaxID=196821 RepID=UPI00381DF578
MAKQVIGLGTAPSGVGGDTPRSAFTKANANFDELYAFLGGNTLPAPKIIESSSNANGRYTKYADGTMLCWGETIGGIDQSTTSQAYAATISLPAAFAGNFKVVPNIVSVNVTNVFSGYSRAIMASATTFQIIQYWNYVQTYSYSWIAIGRWY